MPMRVGKIPEAVLKRSICGQIKPTGEGLADGAGVGRDCAVLAFDKEETKYRAVCTQEAAIREAEDIMLLISRCANSLAAAGARPVAVTLAILLPEGSEEEKLRELMRCARKICGVLKLSIAGGHTSVSGAVTETVVTVTGAGNLTKPLRGAAPGQDIVLSKWAGLEGTSLLAREKRESLSARYPACLIETAERFREYHSVLSEAEEALENGVLDMHDASEGGILGALWELAERAGVGLAVDLKKIPVRQETVEVCEYLGLNPYKLLSGGCLIMVSEDGARLADRLKQKNIPARVVGCVTEGNGRLIINDGEIGYLNRPGPDEVYKGILGRIGK